MISCDAKSRLAQNRENAKIVIQTNAICRQNERLQFFGIMTSQFKTPCRDPKKHPNVRASLALPPMLSRWSCYLCVNEDKSHWVSRHCPSPTHSPKKHRSFSDLEFGKELELAVLQIGKARNKKKYASPKYLIAFELLLRCIFDYFGTLLVDPLIRSIFQPLSIPDLTKCAEKRKKAMDSEPGLGNVFGTLSGWLKMSEAVTIFISLILHRWSYCD